VPKATASPVRILYIHQFFATRESHLGLIRSYEFARRLVRDGHEVVVVTSDSRLPDGFSNGLFTHGEISGIEIRCVQVRYSNYMGNLRRGWSFLLFLVGATFSALRGPTPDVVFATSTPLTVAVPGLIASYLRRRPFVFEVRDLWPEAAIQMGAFKRNGIISRLAKHLERAAYRRATAIIVLSPGMATGVIDEGVDSNIVHQVPNCSDIDLFMPGERDDTTIERFNLSGKFTVAYTGAIGPSNAIESSVPEAARLLQERGRNDIVFLIVGEGKSLPLLRDAKERDALDSMILAGPMPKDEIPKITRTADALMTLFADVPILATNSPNKFFDGLASGRPMIVNSPGWTKTLVEEYDAGVFVPPGDGQALADVVESLADNPNRTASMGANARRLAEEMFSRDIQYNRFARILDEAAR